jgi:hypothetical protein
MRGIRCARDSPGALFATSPFRRAGRRSRVARRAAYVCLIQGGSHVTVVSCSAHCARRSGGCCAVGGRRTRHESRELPGGDVRILVPGLTVHVNVLVDPASKVPLAAVESGLLPIHLPQDNIFGLLGAPPTSRPRSSSGRHSTRARRPTLTRAPGCPGDSSMAESGLVVDCMALVAFRSPPAT